MAARLRGLVTALYLEGRGLVVVPSTLVANAERRVYSGRVSRPLQRFGRRRHGHERGGLPQPRPHLTCVTCTAAHQRHQPGVHISL